MKPALDTGPRRFFATPRTSCPYLDDRLERKVFTELMGNEAADLHDALATAGFRRSQNIIYKPLCDGCAACVPVRVRSLEFRPRRWMRRVSKRNADLVARIGPPVATQEQFALFRRYLAWRHDDGGMADMNYAEYRSMVEDTPIVTRLIEYRDAAGELQGGCLTDLMADGLSLVYSFFAPERNDSSPGSAIILWHIDWARSLGLPFVYLGYWIADNPKMAYKIRFEPLEVLGREGWERR